MRSLLIVNYTIIFFIFRWLEASLPKCFEPYLVKKRIPYSTSMCAVRPRRSKAEKRVVTVFVSPGIRER